MNKQNQSEQDVIKNLEREAYQLGKARDALWKEYEAFHQYSMARLENYQSQFGLQQEAYQEASTKVLQAKYGLTPGDLLMVTSEAAEWIKLHRLWETRCYDLGRLYEVSSYSANDEMVMIGGHGNGWGTVPLRVAIDMRGEWLDKNSKK